MKKIRLHSNWLEHAVGLVALALIAAGLMLYMFNEPARIASAQIQQRNLDIDEAATIYAENCSICHGLAGEGIGTVPALNTQALKEADPATLEKIISRGLFGTAMPAWNVDDGGPLSDYQIMSMVTLLQFADWQLVQDRVVNLGLAPLVPFTTQPDEAVLSTVAGLPEGDLLVQGITLFAGQCVACHGADGLGTALAPALNDPAVREKLEADIERTILYGSTGTLMAGWQNVLVEEDIAALIELIYRWDEVQIGAIPEPERDIPVTVESLQLGADLYTQSCARCHAAEGQGTQRAPSLNVKSYLEQTNDAALEQIITLGVPGTAMPAWGDRLTAVEIQAIVGFIRSWEPTAPEVATIARSGGPWWAAGSSWTPGRLPSGGQVTTDQAQPTAIAQSPTPVSDPLQVQALVDTAATPVPTAHAAQGQGAGGGGNAANQDVANNTGHTGTGGGGPAWAQTTTTVESQPVDWRQWAVLGGGGGLALLLMGLAVRGLIRLH